MPRSMSLLLPLSLRIVWSAALPVFGHLLMALDAAFFPRAWPGHMPFNMRTCRDGALALMVSAGCLSAAGIGGRHEVGMRSRMGPSSACCGRVFQSLQESRL